MSSWANRHVVRKRDLSQIPIEFRPDIVSRVERSEVKLSESFQSPLFSSNPFNEIIYPNTNHKSSEPSFIPNSYSSKVIQPPNPLSIDLTYNNKSYVFVILRHIRYPKDNDLWISSYNSIRKHYTNKIVIIDDNSTINTFNGNSVVLATITKKTQNPINTSINQPLQNALPPTPEDYNRTYFTRYIIKYKLSSELYFVETDKNEYYRLQQSSDQKYYYFSEVLWKISGPLYDVKQDNVLIVGGIIDSNKRSVQEAEKTTPGISNYLVDLTLYSTF